MFLLENEIRRLLRVEQAAKRLLAAIDYTDCAEGVGDRTQDENDAIAELQSLLSPQEPPHPDILPSRGETCSECCVGCSSECDCWCHGGS